MSTPTVSPPRSRDTRSMGGIAGALIAVFGLIAVMGGFAWLQHRPVSDPARTVDFTQTLAVARQQSPFHVVAPEPVPPGLRATSVSWDGVGGRVAWHVGFVASDSDYIGLYQGNGPVAEFVSASTPATTPGEAVTIVGRPWKTLTNAGQSETALVRTVGGVTTVVTGTVPESDLVGFVRSLR